MRDEKLDFWIKNNLNVLFVGRHGVGKTARVKEAFKRNNLKWRYFSAATMDPWCDFIGVPRAVTKPNGAVHLELVRPAEFEEDDIEAIFMDEFNRSHKKVRNAVMELIQFKSINGRAFKNLKIVWAAINPEDEYQVEELDFAQKDRFHVWVDIPYKPDRNWFYKEFGDRLALPALEWWEGLPADQQKIISPRRLDYALNVYRMQGGDIRDVLPPKSNVGKLLAAIQNGSTHDRLWDLFDKKDQEATKRYLAVENNYASAEPYLTKAHEFKTEASEWMRFFLPALPVEKLSAMVATNSAVCEHVMSTHESVPLYRRVMEDIVDANTNKVLIRRINKILGEPKPISIQFGNLQNVSPIKPYFNDSDVDWTTELDVLASMPSEKTPQRFKTYSDLVQKIPAKLKPLEAVETLEFLSFMVGRCHAGTLNDMNNLMGIVNHCINQIHIGQNIGWKQILAVHGSRFDKLLAKIRDARLLDQLLIPVVQPKSISGLIEEKEQ